MYINKFYNTDPTTQYIFIKSLIIYRFQFLVKFKKNNLKYVIKLKLSKMYVLNFEFVGEF